MKLLVEIDGETVPLYGCDYVVWAPCGCPQSVVSAGDDIVTEDDAWKLIYDTKRERDRAKSLRRMELMTHKRYCAEVSPLMYGKCPHTPAETVQGSPRRIQLSNKKGYRRPEGAVSVDQRSPWCNPFAYESPYGLARVPALDGSEWEHEDRISADGMRHDYHHGDGKITFHTVRYMTLAECQELYRRALVNPTRRLHLWGGTGKPWLSVEQARAELAGKDLACWCQLPGPGEPDLCHGAVLLAVANDTTTKEAAS